MRIQRGLRPSVELLLSGVLLLAGCGGAFLVTREPLAGEPEPTLASRQPWNGELLLRALDADGSVFVSVGSELVHQTASGRVLWRADDLVGLSAVLPLGSGAALALVTPPDVNAPAELVRLSAKGAREYVRPVPREAQMLLAPGGRVYVRADSRLGLIDVRTGALAWTVSLSGGNASAAPESFQVARGPIALGHDGALYAAEPQGKSSVLTVTRLSHTGAKEREWPLPGVRGITDLAVLADGRVYAFATAPDTEALGVGRDTLYALGADGSVLWNREVPLGQDTATLVVDARGRAVVAHGSVVEVFGQDGSPAWRRDLCVERATETCGTIRSVAVGPKGLLYVGHRTLDALDASGAELWRFTEVRGEVRGIYFGAGQLFAVDVHDVAGTIDSALVVVGRGGSAGGARSAAKWAAAFQPGRGGLLEPVLPAPAKEIAEAAKAPAMAAGTREEDLCRWGYAEGCIRRALELAQTPEGAGEALALLAPLCGRPTDPGCKSLEEVIAILDKSNPRRATDLLAIRCAGGQRTSCDRACLRGEPSSCYFGCEAESPEGCAILGEMYRDGRGLRVDEERALGMFHRGCSMGSKRACTALTIIAESEGSGFSAAGTDGPVSPSSEGFETFVAEQSAALKLAARRAIEIATKKFGTCTARDSCCLAKRYLLPVCGVLGCVRVPGC